MEAPIPEQGTKSARRTLETDAETSGRMALMPQRDTKPELWVRSAVHAMGRRFRVENRDLPGSPDLANRNGRWAIFVHGCYWHAHPGCPRATVPKRNRDFWLAKFDANRARDARAEEELWHRGFRVLVLWECEVRSGAAQNALHRFFCETGG
jgi:DNA mismatch endonuclease, patch repair protein